MILLLPTLALMAKAMTAVADVCPANHTDIRILQKIDPPRLDLSKMSDQLKRMKFNEPVSDIGFAEVTGLTVHSIAVEYEVRIKSGGVEGGPACVWPSVITVTLSTSPTIYIAADDGDCRHAVAFAHEIQHTDVDRNVITHYTPIFRQRVASMVDAMNGAPPELTLGIDDRRERIEEKINAIVAVTEDVMDADETAQQRALDSPEEYLRRSNACPQYSFDPTKPQAGHMH